LRTALLLLSRRSALGDRHYFFVTSLLRNGMTPPALSIDVSVDD
jgi:hypothetical protein